MSKPFEWNPHKRAFTGGVGKPTKPRKNDGREPEPSQTGMEYARIGASPTRVRSSTVTKTAGIYERLKPFVNTSPVREIHRAPESLKQSPEQRKRWHRMRKLGLIK